MFGDLTEQDRSGHQRFGFGFFDLSPSSREHRA
jgi:hypothetical protein